MTVILAALSASLALGDDFRTIRGKEYKDATVRRIEPDGIVLRTKSGIVKLYLHRITQRGSETLSLCSRQNPCRRESVSNTAERSGSVNTARSHGETTKTRFAALGLQRARC